MGATGPHSRPAALGTHVYGRVPSAPPQLRAFDMADCMSALRVHRSGVRRLRRRCNEKNKGSREWFDGCGNAHDAFVPGQRPFICSRFDAPPIRPKSRRPESSSSKWWEKKEWEKQEWEKKDDISSSTRFSRSTEMRQTVHEPKAFLLGVHGFLVSGSSPIALDRSQLPPTTPIESPLVRGAPRPCQRPHRGRPVDQASSTAPLWGARMCDSCSLWDRPGVDQASSTPPLWGARMCDSCTL